MAGSKDKEAVIDLTRKEVVITIAGEEKATPLPGAEPTAQEAPQPSSPPPRTTAEAEKQATVPASEPTAVGHPASPPPAGAPAGEPVQDAAEHACTPKKPKGNGKPFLQTTRGRQVLVIGVVMIILAAVFVGNFGNESPSAKITVDTDPVQDGQVITISGKGSKDPDGSIKSYKWTLPEEFKFVEGSLSSSEVVGYFDIRTTISDEVLIALEVEDDSGATARTTLEVTVEPLIVDITDELIGDSARYRINGTIEAVNPDGITVVKQGPWSSGEITITQVFIDYTGQHDKAVGSQTTRMDGFMDNHTVYTRTDDYSIEVDERVSYVRTKEVPGDHNVDGNATALIKSYVSTNGNRVAKSHSNFDGYLEVEILSRGIALGGDLIGYPNASVEDTAFHMSRVVKQINAMSTGTMAPYLEDAVWEVKGVQPVTIGTETVPAFKVKVDLSAYVKTNEGYSIIYWLADDHSYPVKSFVKIKRVRDDDTVVETEQYHTMKYYNPGSAPLPDDQTDFKEEEDGVRFRPDSWHRGVPNQKYMTPLDDSRERHGISENEQDVFQPELAIENGRSDTHELAEDFRDYLDKNDDAYMVASLYYIIRDVKRWNFTFAVDGSDEYFNIEIRKQRNPDQYYITDNSLGLIPRSEWQKAKDDIEPTLTYSFAFHMINTHLNELQGDGDQIDVDENDFYDGNDKYRFEDGASIGNTGLMFYPMLWAQERGGITYYSFTGNIVEDVDGDEVHRQLVADAVTGQMMYVAYIEGDVSLSDILAGITSG